MQFSLRQFLLERPKSPVGQLIKYGLCGGISAVIMVVTIVVLNLIFPEYVDAEFHAAETLARHTNQFNTAGFIPSTLLAYFTNRLLVFSPGRHRASVEFAIFCVISVLSYIGGMCGSDWLIKTFNMPSFIGSVGFGVSSALVNFVCRKFFIFK